tara:strand:+ start:975 stop:1490 length:516 start_codon:yes stop_codon:yes gene_type:complete
MTNKDIEIELCKLTEKTMYDRDFNYRGKFGSLDSELRNTFLNFFMIAGICDLEDKDKANNYFKHLKIKYSEKKINFVMDNVWKVEEADKFSGLFKLVIALDVVNDEERNKAVADDFKLIQEMLLIYLGRGHNWNEVMDMRGWTIWRKLKTENKSLIISDLYTKIKLHTVFY